MKKILSITLAAVMLLSIIPTAFAAENNWQGGTKVEYTATANEQYTVTVPATLAPGAAGDVVASGTWGSNRKLTVTADKDVTLTNSINAADQKVLDVTFAGIELTGSNTESVSDTKQVSVANITDAIFGTWSGTFNYNVAMSDVAGGSTTEPSDPDDGDSGSSGDITDLNPDDGSTPTSSSVYKAGDYKYTYSTGNGWSAWLNTEVTDTMQTSYGPILESINGEPVVQMQGTFSGCANLITAPVIPSNVTDVTNAFYNCTSLTTAPVIHSGITKMTNVFNRCTSLTGTVEINANPSQYDHPFYGVDFAAQNLTLTGESTMLDEIGAEDGATNYCADCNGKCQGTH